MRFWGWVEEQGYVEGARTSWPVVVSVPTKANLPLVSIYDINSLALLQRHVQATLLKSLSCTMSTKSIREWAPKTILALVAFLVLGLAVSASSTLLSLPLLILSRLSYYPLYPCHLIWKLFKPVYSVFTWDSSENQIVSRKQARVLVGLGHRWCLGNGYLSAFPKSSKSWDEIKHKYPRKHRLCSQKPIIPGSKRGAIRRQGKKEKVFCRGLAAPMLQGYSPWSLLPQLQVSQTFL